jgi:hypothetical protein
MRVPPPADAPDPASYTGKRRGSKELARHSLAPRAEARTSFSSATSAGGDKNVGVAHRYMLSASREES